MSQCDIYVINIPDSMERRDHIVAQLEASELPYRVFAAVDGKKGSHPLFERYNERKRVRLKGKVLVGGQLGCYASHYLLWEQCVVNNRPMIVLEDDASLFQDRFKTFYTYASTLNCRYECIRLFQNPAKMPRGLKAGKVDELTIYKYNKGYMGTIGYYLTPAGAHKFLRDSAEWFLTVDIFMDRFWSNKVEYYGIEPPCLHYDSSFASDIDYVQSREKFPLRTKLRRELFTTAEAVRRLCWNIVYWLNYLRMNIGSS